ncbi:uncharacterized protein DS421_16g568280 [Arachis hypogaea]|nr:uncharacterized protein DS421_16g568280 [Arachis hypogaea]
MMNKFIIQIQIQQIKIRFNKSNPDQPNQNQIQQIKSRFNKSTYNNEKEEEPRRCRTQKKQKHSNRGRN